MVKSLHTTLILLLIACLPSYIYGQENHDSIPQAEISLITCSPGAEIYELCGHTALRVRMNETDLAVNYGTFDFNAPNFVYRFVKGETDYMVAAYPFRYFIEEYRRQGRSITEQKLDLTPEEIHRLLELLDINLRAGNRTYRYNYVKDNCSTRPLTIIEEAVGDSIALNSPAGYAGLHSFRDIMRSHHVNYPWYQFGIDLALGNGIDYPVTDREKAFAPLILEEMMESATINGHRAVKSTATILEASPEGGPRKATPWYLTPMAAGIVVLAVSAVTAFSDVRRRRVTRWVDAVLFTVYGLCGLLLAFLVFISVHEATSPNWLLLWLNPLCLAVPALIYIKKCRRLLKLYGFINFASLILLIVVWSFTGQSGNPAFIPFVAADMILTVRYIYITICAEKTISA